MAHNISAVYTAQATARAVRALLVANLGLTVKIEVTNVEETPLMVRVRLVQQEVATGVTPEGREVVISLGEPDEGDSKHPTIVVA